MQLRTFDLIVRIRHQSPQLRANENPINNTTQITPPSEFIKERPTEGCSSSEAESLPPPNCPLARESA